MVTEGMTEQRFLAFSGVSGWSGGRVIQALRAVRGSWGAVLPWHRPAPVSAVQVP